ncbi:hypothetical protein Tdes44962_MAKER03714 [Teratosphaeria destructans]|uniref:Nucleic acid-binding protein n=1 Tax=Teratosphaeria destructans TaxID=418781 RepID=A0A9W7SPI5_9PEZI|nr:hypothetical protein Tdes44962_MAKER03714 [Teratosphaeria destructans]
MDRPIIIKGNTSIQACYPPTPSASSDKAACSSSQAVVGDGFTAEELEDALRPRSTADWHPQVEYAECSIRDLYPGPRAVTFMGRVANLYDAANTPKTLKSAKGCMKLCVKDETAAITVRWWFAQAMPQLRLGSLVTIWTNHVSNGENGTLSSTTAPLFVSLFPERDRSCHVMIHDNSDNGSQCTKPLGFRAGRPLPDLMTLQNFIDGGYDVVEARILVVVKSMGAKKRVTRKDDSVVENMNLQIHDDTAEATLGLWGTIASSPLGRTLAENNTNPDQIYTRRSWKAGETVLLLQAPGWKMGRSTYLTLSAATMVDVDPPIPDADWLRRWSLRQKSREAINPPFPQNTFDLQTIKHGPVRGLYTLNDLDSFARAAPNETFQGYLSVLVTDVKLHECYKRQMLFSGECCNMACYANATLGVCKGCDGLVELRLNPRIIGQVMDETGCVGTGKLLFSEQAWRDLLGRMPQDLLKLGHEEIKYLADRLSFMRLTFIFAWTGDGTTAGERICVLGVLSS